MAEARLTIEHSGDGTLLYGTERGDSATAAIKRAGFRWSRSLDAWFLPRPWSEATRMTRVRELLAELGDEVQLDQGELARSETPDELAERRVASGFDRADRLEARADRLDGDAGQRLAAADRISEHIPLGQPILVGHHSERRHRKDLERIHNHTRAGLDAQSQASAARGAASSARHNAEHHDDPALTRRRLARDQADLRAALRAQGGSLSAGEYAERIAARIAELRARIERHERILAAAELAGVKLWSRADFPKGKQWEALIRGTWERVVRANPKTLTIDCSHMFAGHTLTIDYSKVTGAREVSESEGDSRG